MPIQDPSTIISTAPSGSIEVSTTTTTVSLPATVTTANVYANYTTVQATTVTTVNKPGGNAGDIQFQNADGTFGGDPDLTYNPTSNDLTVQGAVTAGSIRTDRYQYANGMMLAVGYSNTNTAAYLNSGFISNATIKITGGTNGQVLTTNGSGALSWATSGTYTAGTGLTLTGSQFSVTSTGVAAATYGNSTHVGTFTVNAQGQLTAASNVAITANAQTLTGTILNPSVVTSSLTSVGTLASLTVTGTTTSGLFSGSGASLSALTGANVTGQVANALVAGTVYTAAQANITSVGTLTGLTVNGLSNFGAVGNVNITGGTAGQVLSATGVGGGLQWSTVTGGLPLANGTTNFDIAAINGNATITANGFTWTKDTNGNATFPGALIGDTPNNNGYLQWVGNSSGDGIGYTTLRLVPDDTLTATDQYLIIDPTAPQHIHIRAGGTQDNSAARLILGGEISHVMIPEGQDPAVVISSNNRTWIFNTDGSLTAPGSILPDSNVSYNLGSTTQRWNSIYLSNNTIYMGDSAISASGGSLTVDGNPVVAQSSSGTTTLGSAANLKITGGSNGQVLTTDGTGNLSWTSSGGGGGTSLPFLELTNTGFIGNAVVFTKTNYGSEVDNIDANVAITRGDNQGIYNPLVEGSWNSSVSPENTEWNADGWDDLTNVTARTYTSFYNAVGGNLGNNVLGLKLVMHDTVNDKYYTLIFSQWTAGGGGGGFIYTRHQIDVANSQSGITFADGTVQTTAYTGVTDKTWTNPNDNTWRIVEYSGGAAVELTYPTANYNTSATDAQVIPDSLVINSNTDPGTTIPMNDLISVTFNGITYVSSGWSQGGGIYTIYFNTPFPVYTAGDSVTLNYRNTSVSPDPVVWWDAANSPGGASQFRGAIIEYHAYSDDCGTVIGTIHVAQDDERTATHTEATSGGNDTAMLILWDRSGNDGQVLFKRSDNGTDTLFIQWTSKIFYGSEYYC